MSTGRVGVGASLTEGADAPEAIPPANAHLVSQKQAHSPHRLYGPMKRAIDLLFGGGLLLAISPLFVAISFVVKLTSPGPILYVHRRVGQNGRLFRCYKFRTMVDGAAARREELRAFDIAGGPAFKMRADPRVTLAGSVLRRWSLDEIPQLLNVLRGDMSLVGPRPLAEEDFARCADTVDMPTLEHVARRLEVVPGLTGLWQVSGRSDLSFERWMELDAEYIDRRSLAFDIQLLARTVPAVLSARGAY